MARRVRACDAISAARARAAETQERFAVDVRAAVAAGVGPHPELGACPISLAQPMGIAAQQNSLDQTLVGWADNGTGQINLLNASTGTQSTSMGSTRTMLIPRTRSRSRTSTITHTTGTATTTRAGSSGRTTCSNSTA